MPYTIRFSDPTKFDTITVPDMPPGINSVDTSLSLVGKGYPNYGQKFAENFVKLLENFASPIPPENPIEGQLWYDTSNPDNKILKIMDGTAEATRWPNANGIYQQGTDPKDSATQGLKIGDIWVDTASNQLKIFNSNDWTLVGPNLAGPEPTGTIPSKILDTNNIERNVIISKIAGKVVSIEAYELFTPKSVIDGFTILRPGINLSNTVFETGQPIPIFNGTALRSASLIDTNGTSFLTSVFLRKNDQSQYGQIITGKIRYSTPPTNTASMGQGQDGIVINNESSIESDSYIQFYKGGNDAIILNNTANSKIILKVKGGALLATVLEITSNSLSLAGSATISKTLLVANTLTISSTATTAISVAGGMSLTKDARISGALSVVGVSTLSGQINVGSNILPTNNAIQDIGSTTQKFKQVYADILGTTGSVFIGTFNGLAIGLQQATEFKIHGQVTGTSVLYNGTSSSATFVTSLMPTAISNQTLITNSTSSLNLLVLDTSTTTLNQISRDNFLSNIFLTGMVMSYGTSTNIPSGWLLCDGSEYVQTGTYTNLFSLIGSYYGSAAPGFFKVPDLRYATTTTNDKFISYIIKT